MDLANEVRGLLKIFGIRMPMTVKRGSFDGVVRPLIEMDDVLVHALEPLLDARVVLYQHFWNWIVAGSNALPAKTRSVCT